MKQKYEAAWAEVRQIAKICKKYNFDCSKCPLGQKCISTEGKP